MGGRKWQPKFAARLMKPFLDLLRDDPNTDAAVIAHYDAMDPEDRVPAETALKLLEFTVELTGNPDLGLDAADSPRLGDWDVLEYASNTCRTFGEGLEVLGRYIGLINESVTYHLERTAPLARLWIASELVQPRSAIDFQLASIYASALNWRGAEMPAGIQIWFSYPEPASTRRHREIFGNCELRFDAGCNAFVLPYDALDMPLSSSDPKLNELLRRHADRLLEGLSEDSGFTGIVHRLIVESLPSGRSTVELIAAHLEMSRRTLLRKLEREGTTFKQLLDDTRQTLASRYLESGQLTTSDVALLLGFAQTAAFHRAFKRWTGETPAGYQRRVRLSSEVGDAVSEPPSASTPRASGAEG